MGGGAPACSAAGIKSRGWFSLSAAGLARRFLEAQPLTTGGHDCSCGCTDPRQPRETQFFHRHGLWVCVAPFKSKEPESKRPRICLEEGRAAT